MAYYLIRGTYSAEGYRGMIDNPRTGNCNTSTEPTTRHRNDRLFQPLSGGRLCRYPQGESRPNGNSSDGWHVSGAFTKVSAEELTPSTVFLEAKKPVPKSLTLQTAMKSTDAAGRMTTMETSSNLIQEQIDSLSMRGRIYLEALIWQLY